MQTFRPVIRWWSLVNPRILAHFSESLVVHPDRFIFRKGILDKSEVVIPFARITNYADQQSFFDRIFGISNFKVETAGSSIAPELTLNGYPYELRSVLARALGRANGP
ncbi:MAG: PH domain-containing protein [Bacteroidota bacterium]